jgi:hypothetical protein
MATAAASTTGWDEIIRHNETSTSMEHFDFTAVDTNFVRLAADQSSCEVSNHARVYELEVWGVVAPPPPPPGQLANVALHKPVLADSTYGPAEGSCGSKDGASSCGR